MYRKPWILVSIVTLSLMVAAFSPALAQDSTATPAPTQQPQPTTPPLTASTEFFATSNFRVNVRSGPGTQYTILGQVRVGDALDITGRTANNQWLRVNFNGQEGWISAALFDVTGDVATAPEATAGPNAVLRQTSAQSNAAQAGNVTVVTRVNANLRSLPSISGDVLATIPFGTQLTVTGRSNSNNWVQVSFENQTGWISSGLVTFQRGNVDTVTQFDASGNVIPATQAPPAQPTGQATAQPATTEESP
ncbi:MAG: SH3 domain-containing protein [Anaerolineae bacterium]|nr:SH3 domain-containing protein [Anaerolineae bacterium]